MRFISRESQIRVIDQQSLGGLLSKHGISADRWGQGQAKRVQDLFEEVQEGETVLVERGDELLRKVQVVSVKIYYWVDGVRYELVEDHQEFKDGRIRRREMEGSVSEKMKPGENPRTAAIRGIREELGVNGSLDVKGKGKSEKQITSPSYPGLTSKYVTHKFETTFTPDQFFANGYIEDDGKKKTFFVWKQT